MDANTIVFRDTINGADVKLTAGHCMQSDELLAVVLAHGVRRILNSAATNKAEDVSTEAAKEARAHQIMRGELWSRGGGNTLSDAERHRRDILASYGVTYANLKRSAAEDMARKDPDKLASEAAAGIIQGKENKKPNKERLAAGVKKFWEKVESEVKQRMETVSADIDI